MPRNNKGRDRRNGATQRNYDTRNYTADDPVLGWFNLAKPARMRQPKRSWGRSRK
ncbi:hypothetical protein AGMMS50256_29070 [Betaproteobacteria bacterium]|nr:hypothetical protein AGMMS50256_29070 [Betaproteobacteria bacterium]